MQENLVTKEKTESDGTMCEGLVSSHKETYEGDTHGPDETSPQSQPVVHNRPSP